MNSKFITNLGKNSSWMFLALLICADCGFIALHSIETLTPLIDNALYSLEKDGGYAEIYQCLKWLWIVILLVLIAISRRSFSYLSWGAVFGYFLVDDGLCLHERGGYLLSKVLTVTPPFGLRLQDVGELIVTGTAAAILLVFVAWAYWRGTSDFKKVSRDIMKMILVFAVFSVGVDMAHISIQLGWKVTFILGIIEDGGEMLVASLMLWYAFMLSSRGAAAQTIDQRP